jgi:hypothetical protein
VEDEELARATAIIPEVLGSAALSASDLVTALRANGVGEEATRLAMWYLIDRGAIELTANWRVRAWSADAVAS